MKWEFKECTPKYSSLIPFAKVGSHCWFQPLLNLNARIVFVFFEGFTCEDVDGYRVDQPKGQQCIENHQEL